jgi:hypothetical protein
MNKADKELIATRIAHCWVEDCDTILAHFETPSKLSYLIDSHGLIEYTGEYLEAIGLIEDGRVTKAVHKSIRALAIAEGIRLLTLPRYEWVRSHFKSLDQ